MRRHNFSTPAGVPAVKTDTRAHAEPGGERVCANAAVGDESGTERGVLQKEEQGRGEEWEKMGVGSEKEVKVSGEDVEGGTAELLLKQR